MVLLWPIEEKAAKLNLGRDFYKKYLTSLWNFFHIYRRRN